MHVTIVQLTPDRDRFLNFDADTLYDANDNKFDSIEEHVDEERNDDIDSLIRYLGDAATSGEEDGVRWIDIDRKKAVGLFRRPFDRFLAALQTLHHNDLRDFATGKHEIEQKLDALNDNYHFDGIYVIGNYTHADPISDWLRHVIRYDDVPTRYYVRATYDGDQ